VQRSPQFILVGGVAAQTERSQRWRKLGASIETMGGGCLQLALTSKAPVALDERRLQLKE